MSAIPVLAQLGGATTLLMAATSKIAAPDRIVATVNALGLRPTAPLARALVAAELAAATALAVHPAGPITPALVLGLGSAFALAGLRAHRRGITVSCACFGAGSARPLGLRQVAAWPLWLAVAALATASPLGGADGLLALAAAGVALAVGIAGAVLTTTRGRQPADPVEDLDAALDTADVAVTP